MFRSQRCQIEEASSYSSKLRTRCRKKEPIVQMITQILKRKVIGLKE